MTLALLLALSAFGQSAPTPFQQLVIAPAGPVARQVVETVKLSAVDSVALVGIPDPDADPATPIITGTSRQYTYSLAHAPMKDSAMSTLLAGTSFAGTASPWVSIVTAPGFAFADDDTLTVTYWTTEP